MFSIRLVDRRDESAVKGHPRRFNTVETAIKAIRKQRGWSSGGISREGGSPNYWMQAQVVDAEGAIKAHLVYVEVYTYDQIVVRQRLVGSADVRQITMRWIRFDEETANAMVDAEKWRAATAEWDATNDDAKRQAGNT